MTSASPCLDHLPPLSEVPEVAGQARLAWGLRPASRLDIYRVCARLGIEVSVVPMDVPAGGAQGFLIPRRSGGFRIEVDPEPAAGWQTVDPPLRKTLERHRTRFLVAHELAHTLFFERGSGRPRRLVSDSTRQEEFCDELARSLLVPPPAAAQAPFSPDAVVALQRRYDISMEVALRSTVRSRGSALAWLLLPQGETVLVQWTSADRRLTARALRQLRQLSNLATERGRAEGRLAEASQSAFALYLPGRKQVVVTGSS